MRNISRFLFYLKPYKFTLVILLVGFIFQQICALFLPMLMSSIVDVGIRQKGIKEVSPYVISANSYRIMESFMYEGEREVVNNNYMYVNTDNFKNNESIIKSNKINLNLAHIYNTDLNKFKEGLYVLRDVDNTTHEKLKESFLNSTSRLIKYINSRSDKDLFISPNNEKYNYFLDFSNFNEFIINVTPITDIQLEFIDSIDLSDFDPYQVMSSFNYQFYNELGIDTLKIQTGYILKIGLLMVLVILVSLVFVVIENYYTAKMSSGVSLKLREDVFKKVENFSDKEFDKISVSSLITRTTNDVSQVKDTILMGVNFVVPPVMFIGGIIMAIKTSMSMSWTIMLGAIVSSVIVASVFIIIFPKVKLMQEIFDKFNLIIRERLSGIMVINSFGNLEIEEKRFDKENRKLSSISEFVNRTIMFMTPFLTVAMNIINILIIWLGAKQISESKMQVGDLMAFTQYSTMVIGAFLMLVMMFSSLPHAAISIDRILEILDKRSSIQDPQNPIDFEENFKGIVSFEHVYFSYGDNDNYVLKDINFKINPGEVTGIVGPTGSGKSTLVKLIPRFYDTTSGDVLIDNVNVKDVRQYDLREKISYVPQKSVLFSGDILYNLKYGNQNANQSRIDRCVSISQISEILKNEENRFDKLISQEGKNLSGGQRQRVCIARSLIRDSCVYIFDDSFSSLDFNTESVIREGMFKYLNKASVVVVSQRVSTIIGADKIVVLNKGKIVGEGIHKNLIKECKTYREIVESQMPEGVLL